MPRTLLLPLGLAAALAGTVAWQLAAVPSAAPRRAPIIAATAAARPPAVQGPPARDTAEGWVKAALARPLFLPDRRPAASAQAAPSAAEEVPRLTGVLSGPFGRRAILAGANGRSAVVSVGSTFGGWTVQAIDGGVVVVAGRDGKRTVRLAYGITAKPPPGPPAEPPDDHANGELLRMPAGGPRRPPPDVPYGRR